MMFLPANSHRTAMELTERTYAGNYPLSKKTLRKRLGDTNSSGSLDATDEDKDYDANYTNGREFLECALSEV